MCATPSHPAFARRRARTWPSGRGLADQFVTVRVLARALLALATVGAGGWWFLLDEVRAVRDDGRARHFEVVRALDESTRFQVEQRARLYARIDGMQSDVAALTGEVGTLGAEVRHVGRTTEAILSAISDRLAQRREETGGAPGAP